jgi:ligand-binding sensor domain-containing protein
MITSLKRAGLAVGCYWLFSAALLGQTPLKKDWLEGTWSYLTTDNGLSSNVVISIAIEGNYVWFGTYAGGASCLNRWDGKWKIYTTKGEPALPQKTLSSLDWENTLEDNHVTAIAADPPGDVWFGTTFYGYKDVFGVSRFRRNAASPWTVFGQRHGILNNDITSIAVDADFVWVGTQSGLARYSKRAKKWDFFKSPEQLPDKYVNAVLCVGDEVWVGTGSGISVYSRANRAWRFYTKSDGLPEDSIQAFCCDGTYVWTAGTYGSLAVFNRQEGVWTPMMTGDPLDDKWVKSMATDGRYLWVARDGGVSCYSMETKTWLALMPADGLGDGRVNAVAIDGHTVWFGTGNGVSRLELAH